MLDIVIPVYNQKPLVDACLDATCATADPARHEIVVIDDCSTDPDLRAALAERARSGQITLLTNPENSGFTRTANRGLRLHPDRDVILLNSDTVVFADWIDRLRSAAYAHSSIATANPLSNATHIGTYPFRRHDGDARFEIPDAEIDRIAKETNAGRLIDVHTTVGFCMYIKRACLDEIGLLDEAAFPVGYGEESDLCYRAQTVGWRHVIATDIFVRHWEARSFGADTRARMLVELHDRFIALHPDLLQKDGAFWELDPIRPAREALDLARLRRLLAGARTLPCRLAASEGLHLRIDPATATAEFAVAPYTLPNLPRLRLPEEVATLNTHLRTLGIDTLALPSEADRDALERLIAGQDFELGLEPARAVQPVLRAE